ncbi:hypothetical protein EVAR_34810_1 [Eumeta japonica]|uniref:Uncharacterized protein n=1 Tax=Eumeta variegata TaxID=151549 RepID=A0A4C1WDT9_EUMVA|nr:hypothetical protein EVAR_34810_1 [Eumeta japonica]
MDACKPRGVTSASPNFWLGIAYPIKTSGGVWEECGVGRASGGVPIVFSLPILVPLLFVISDPGQALDSNSRPTPGSAPVPDPIAVPVSALGSPPLPAVRHDSDLGSLKYAKSWPAWASSARTCERSLSHGPIWIPISILIPVPGPESSCNRIPESAHNPVHEPRRPVPNRVYATTNALFLSRLRYDVEV